MLDEEALGSGQRPGQNDSEKITSEDLVALSYRSVPAVELSSRDLKELLKQARNKNAQLQVTGVIVIGRQRIYQWLEGPRKSVDRLIERIAVDTRHRDLQILERGPIAERLFGPWTMLLATDSGTDGDVAGNGVSLPMGSITGSGSHAAPSQAKLRDVADKADRQSAEQAVIVQHEGLQHLSFQTELQRRLEHRSEEANREKWDLAASALTTLLLENDFSRVEHFLRSMSRRETDPLPIQISLLEQSERRLGDLWLDNLCSDLEINTALSDMIRALRSVNFGALPIWRVQNILPEVLVVPQPGESHMLPAVLDAEVLWQHGWDPTLEFPKQDQDLEQMLSEHWYAALDISMSGVFRRPDNLGRLANTVELARAASANKNIAITVGGRAVYEDRSLLIELGADALVRTAKDVETAIQGAIKRRE
ncbi:MAG: BLUF domain-containing protein [Pseudomonadota bacterium]